MAGDKVFRVSSEQKTYKEAGETCRKWGGKMADLRGEGDKNYVETLIDTEDKYW